MSNKINYSLRKKGIIAISALLIGAGISYGEINAVSDNNSSNTGFFNASSRTIYVNNDSGNFHGDGSIGSPYNDLQEAIVRAQEGDTIKFVGSITYRIPSNKKSLLVDKNITIDGGSNTLILSGGILEFASDAVVNNIVLEMQIDGNSNDAKIYTSGHSIQFNNIKFNGVDNALPTLVVGSLGDRAVGNNPTITVNNGDAELVFHKILIGDEDSNIDAVVNLILNGSRIKSNNGIIIGDNHSVNSNVTIESSSNLMNNIVANNSTGINTFILKNNAFITGANLNNLSNIVVDNASISTNSDFVGSENLTVNLIGTNSKLNLSEKNGQVNFNRISGNGKVVLSTDTNISVNNLSADTTIEVDDTTGTVPTNRTFVIASMAEGVKPKLVLASNRPFVEVVKEGNNWQFRKEPTLLLYVSYTPEGTNNADHLISEKEVKYIDNNPSSYLGLIKDDNVLANKVLLPNPETENDGDDEKLTLIDWTAKDVGNLIIDGQSTPYTITWTENDQEVSYNLVKPEGKHFEQNGSELASDKYGNVVLTDDARFADIVLSTVEDEKAPETSDNNNGTEDNGNTSGDNTDTGNNGNTDAGNTNTENNGDTDGDNTDTENNGDTNGSSNTDTSTPENGGSTTPDVDPNGSGSDNNSNDGTSTEQNGNNENTDAGNTNTENNGDTDAGNTDTSTPENSGSTTPDVDPNGSGSDNNGNDDTSTEQNGNNENTDAGNTNTENNGDTDAGNTDTSNPENGGVTTPDVDLNGSGSDNNSNGTNNTKDKENAIDNNTDTEDVNKIENIDNANTINNANDKTNSQKISSKNTVDTSDNSSLLSAMFLSISSLLSILLFRKKSNK